MPADSFSSKQDPIQILMVDDDVDQLEISRISLEDTDSNLKVTGVTTPEEAIKLLEENRFDCVVSDYQMPGMNGIMLADKTRETSDIPFIIYTGKGSEEVAEAAFAAGVDDYARKEQGLAHFKVLTKRIRSHIDHHRSRLRSQLHYERIEALHINATRLARSESVEEVAEVTFNTLSRVLGFEGGGFAIVEDGKLRIIESMANLRGTLELPINGKGITVRAVRTGETQLVDDVREDEDYLSLGSGKPMRSELDVPVFIDSKVVALLTVISSTVSAFNDDDRKLLETLAKHVTSAMSRIHQTEALTEAKEKYRTLVKLAYAREAERSAILDAIPGALSLKDNDYRIIWANDAIARNMGLTHDDVIGKICYEVAYGRDKPCDGCLFSKALESRERVRGEKTFADRKIRDVTVRPVLDEGGNIIGFLESSRNITERKRMEEELRSYAGNLERRIDERSRELLDAERMVAAGRVSATLGHDLRGPLVTISNAAKLARKRPENLEHLLTMIENNADRSIAMLEDLRERLREGPLLLDLTDLGALIRKAMEESLIPDSVTPVLRINDNLGSVMLDALQMLRCLDNLIGNALDAMPGGGVLTISADRDGETVRLEVSDTGVGISEDDMKDLFSPFQSRKSGGLGLGLASCRQSVVAHGGSITVESEVGKGTTFAIAIPLVG